MHFDTYSDFVPLIMIVLTLWLMRARFTSPIDTPWPMLYYFVLVLFIRSFEGEFNNYVIFAGRHSVRKACRLPCVVATGEVGDVAEAGTAEQAGGNGTAVAAFAVRDHE